MTELTKEMVENFILHPDWILMQRYIEEHFENSTNIKTIDVSNPSSTVHAEVIARQKIDEDLESLRKSFKVAKDSYGKKKVTYE